MDYLEYLLKMKRRLDNRCDWSRCLNTNRCIGCGPIERMRYLASARPLYQTEMTEGDGNLRVFLYDGEDLYPETQIKLETSLVRLARGKL